MTTKAAHRVEQARRERANEARRTQAARERRGRLIRGLAVASGLLAVVGLVAVMMITSQPQSSSAARRAPDFTLTDTSGGQVTLSDLRGQDVLIYFSEGAGCQSCLVQMAEIERSVEFAKTGVKVLPIVMNTREQILADMAANGVRTPFLLDDGTVSKSYGVLGKGMHAGLPGHSFVFVDKSGRQRWYGEYPSMWLDTQQLLGHVRKHLSA